MAVPFKCTFEQRGSFNPMKPGDSYSPPDYKPLIQALYTLPFSFNAPTSISFGHDGPLWLFFQQHELSVRYKHKDPSYTYKERHARMWHTPTLLWKSSGTLGGQYFGKPDLLQLIYLCPPEQICHIRT